MIYGEWLCREHRRVDAREQLRTAQHAAAGRSDPEIGAQSFLSPRTVEWHLRVFTTVGVGSREERVRVPGEDGRPGMRRARRR